MKAPIGTDISIVFVAFNKTETAIYIMIAVRGKKGEEVVEGVIFIVINYVFACMDWDAEEIPEETIEEAD